MKKTDQLSAPRLGLLFAGCFLGAGYVSGQELWQFFGAYGSNGYLGLIVAAALLFGIGCLILRLTKLSGEDQVDRVVIPWDCPPLRFAMGGLEAVFLFGVAAIMSAGVGALLERLLGLSHVIGSAIFSVAVLLIALLGLRGLVSAFSVSVPLLVGCTVLFGVLALVQNGFALPQLSARESSNPLLGSWLLSAVTFACYNSFGSIGILAPFANHASKSKLVFRGVGLGTLCLVLIALSVLLSMSYVPASAEAQLPMLELAAGYGTATAALYAVLLVLAMFGTALSSFVALLDFLSKKLRLPQRQPKLSAGLLMLSAFGASLLGFGDLIGVLYPLFGYASALFLALMLVHYIKIKKAKTITN